MKRVLIACERSGKVREAFRKRGFDAWSCDLVPADDGSAYHLIDDALEIASWRGQWGLMIAHPPCTYLCNSGVRWLSRPGRFDTMKAAARFFTLLSLVDIPHIAIENPIPHVYARAYLGKYTQIIQPWMFGHPESKATCLWLQNLPKLVETNNVKHIWANLPKSQSQRVHYLPPSADRARLRSETYTGIAEAMAEQWGPLL